MSNLKRRNLGFYFRAENTKKITVLLVALTAYRMGYEDKIRFVKSFVPNFLNQ